MTKNTPQNKAAFFAQYVNQPVYVMDGSNVVRLLRPTRVIAGPGDYLSLKSLSEISDEDAIEVARIARYDHRAVNPENGRKVIFHLFAKEDAESIEINKSAEWLSNSIYHSDVMKICDYLRSKSYLLPFRDITVEEILSFGWARINNDKTNE